MRNTEQRSEITWKPIKIGVSINQLSRGAILKKAKEQSAEKE